MSLWDRDFITKMTLAHYELTKGWRFKETGSEDWLPVLQVPTNVHIDLIANKK